MTHVVVMIGSSLACIVNALNTALFADAREPRVLLSPLVLQDGSVPAASLGKVLIVLTSVDLETNANAGSFITRAPAVVSHMADVLHLNLRVLIATTNLNQQEGLDELHSIVSYLDRQPIFNPGNTAEFPASAQQMTFHFEKLSYADRSALWSYLGASYVPSVNYTVRLTGQTPALGA